MPSVGGTASTVLVTGVAVLVPPPLVAIMFNVNGCPLVPVMPVLVQVKFGFVPLTFPVSQVTPSVVYQHEVTVLSLSANVAFRSNGLSTNDPEDMLYGVTLPAIGAVVSLLNEDNV